MNLARFPVRLLITFRDMQQPSRLSETTIHKLRSPLYLPLSTYILVKHPPPRYTETILGKRASNDIHLSPTSQLTHADAAGTLEYMPAQHRHASVDRHEAVRAAVLHQLPSAARRHAHMLHLSSTPPFDEHTLVGQEGTSRGIQQTHKI